MAGAVKVVTPMWYVEITALCADGSTVWATFPQAHESRRDAEIAEAYEATRPGRVGLLRVVRRFVLKAAAC